MNLQARLPDHDGPRRFGSLGRPVIRMQSSNQETTKQENNECHLRQKLPGEVS
jgi:hypothetical protein